MNAQEVQQESYGKRVKKFLYTTLNAMTFGIFGTIVVGAIIQTLGTILGLAGILPEVNVLNGRVAPILTSLLGMGIGLSIGLSLKLTGLKLVMISVAGGISTLLKVDFSLPGWFNANTPTNNPITAYFVVISVYFVIEAIFRKKTVYDLFFIPVVGVLAAVLACYVFSWPIEQLMELIYATIRFFMNIEPYTTSAFVALIFGILLTLPFISSAGVAAVIFTLPFSNNDPIAIIAMCAAVVGCTAQMVGFSIQTIRKNDIGTIFTIGLASSMFQFKNVMKKPMTWVPTLIASFVLAPLCYVIFDGYQWFIDGAITNASPQLWPGMGSSGLVGQLLTLSTANFSGTAWLFVGAQIVFPALLVFGLDVLFIKMKWYSEDDLILDTTL